LACSFKVFSSWLINTIQSTQNSNKCLSKQLIITVICRVASLLCLKIPGLFQDTNYCPERLYNPATFKFREKHQPLTNEEHKKQITKVHNVVKCTYPIKYILYWSDSSKYFNCMIQPDHCNYVKFERTCHGISMIFGDHNNFLRFFRALKIEGKLHNF